MGLFDAFSQGGFALLNPLGYGGAKSQADAAEQAGQATLDAANKQVQMSQDALQKQIQARADAIKQVQGIAGLSPEEISSINQILTTKTTALNASSHQHRQTTIAIGRDGSASEASGPGPV
jgi:hypothetical protein